MIYIVKKKFASYNIGDRVQLNDEHAKRFAEFIKPEDLSQAKAEEKIAEARENKKAKSEGKK